jgi:hypothetical protein
VVVVARVSLGFLALIHLLFTKPYVTISFGGRTNTGTTGII